jgi:hypothetical protein
MPATPPTPNTPGAPDPDRAARRLAAVEEMIDIGLALARMLRGQAAAGLLTATEYSLACARLARAVRLSVMLAERLEAGIGLAETPALKPDADEAAASAVGEAEPGEPQAERERGEARAPAEPDESAWLTRPIAALAAKICADLGVSYDVALWEDGTGEGPSGSGGPSGGNLPTEKPRDAAQRPASDAERSHTPSKPMQARLVGATECRPP